MPQKVPLSMSAALRLPFVERHLSDISPTSVIEVGCGIGAMAVRLASRYEYRGYEPDRASFEVAAGRLAVIGRGEVKNQAVPLVPDRQFDLLVAFEVLEHIEDDETALRSWTEWVVPGGSLLVSVPAHPHRFGPSDLVVGHYRRYTRAGLTELVRRVGAEVVTIEAWGVPAGYVLEAARNSIAARRDLSQPRSALTARSGRFLQPPEWLGSCVELAMKPLAAIQRPFAATELGIGFIARGRRIP